MNDYLFTSAPQLKRAPLGGMHFRGVAEVVSVENSIPLGFKEKVRVLDVPATRETNLVGREGEVWGMISPSETGIEAVGPVHNDCGAFVIFADPEQAYCLPLEYLEFLDFTPGETLITVGVPRRWTFGVDRKWHEGARLLPPGEWRAWLAHRLPARSPLWIRRLLQPAPPRHAA